MSRLLPVLLLLAACPARPTASEGLSTPPPVVSTPAPPPEPTPEPTPKPEPTPGPRADGEPCLAPADCASGVCEGEGCADNQPGTCAPELRACTRDLVPYCSCEGETFRTSGSCPGKRYSARAACAP